MADCPTGTIAMTTLRDALDDYILFRHLSTSTIAWYRRVAAVYQTWAGREVLLSDFDGRSISRLLLAKQEEGLSPYYLKSLRAGLLAILRDIRGTQPIERVRTVKTPRLNPQCWTPEQVELLLAACHFVGFRDPWRLMLTVALGYYSGMDRCDIAKLQRKDIGPDGAIEFQRSKTGTRLFVAVPVSLLPVIDKHCPAEGKILDLGVTDEWFRRVFQKAVKFAGLVGTFKTLRKGSGSAVEAAAPGTGHRHLGNTRAIFERHYECRAVTQPNPTMPPPIRLPA